MSFLSELFGSLFGDSNAKSSADPRTTHPCANCPSDCAIAGDACEVCAPYKKKLIDLLYYVDHLEEFRARYEVTGLTGSTGAITCPYCGAQTENHYVCEYCGSKLSENTGKIKVASASDIPNPIMQAQDIIYERYEAVIRQYSQNTAGIGAEDGLFSDLISLFKGESTTDTSEKELGAKMSEAEIIEAAALYNTTVSDYLTGLDNGKYLTLAGRKAVQTYTGSTDYVSYTPAGAGMPGVAGIEFLTGLLLSGRYHRRPPVHPLPHPPVHPAPRPPVHPVPRPSHGILNPDPFAGPRRNDLFANPKKPAPPKNPVGTGIPKKPAAPKPPVGTGFPNRPAGTGSQRRNDKPFVQNPRQTNSTGWGSGSVKTGWGTIKRNSGIGSVGGSSVGRRNPGGPGSGQKSSGNRPSGGSRPFGGSRPSGGPGPGSHGRR